MERSTILYSKDSWLYSPLSIARFYGCIKIDGKLYIICGDKGDLVLDKFVAIYKKMKREDFIKIINENKDLSDKELKAKMEEMIKHPKTANKEVKEQELFKE